MAAQRPIDSFSCLTFDCFGTLIDWETGLYAALSPLIQQLPPSHPLQNDRLGALKAFSKHEGYVQSEKPTELYNKVLAESYVRLATELGVIASAEDKERFGASVGDWKPFPDTVSALQRLKKHFKLVILSNVDRASFARTLSTQLAGVEFDAIYTAEDIGSYKPDQKNFQYLIDHCEKELGVKKDKIIHTAYSLFHDLVPAAKIGLSSSYIERGQEENKSAMGGDVRDFQGQLNFSWHFQKLEEMADAVDASTQALS
jgi:2-haloalkanoic acid dehalogenase type II